MAAQLSGQPVYILKEGSERVLGKDARRMNITVAQVVANAVKTTLGPKGMDKMLVDSTGDVVITNDGAAILKAVEVKHPAAKMIVEVAKTMENEAGDGTTSAVVFAGELLKKAEGLLDQEVHATVITKGYLMAEEEALKVVKEIARKVSADDNKTLNKIAATSLNSKAPGITAKEHVAQLAVDAVKAVAEKSDGKFVIDKEDILIVKQVGASTADSELINGIVLEKEKLHSNMPRRVSNARIALVDAEMKVKKTETDAKLSITSPKQMQMFIEEEESSIREMVNHVAKSGANVLFCKKGIEDLAAHYLAKENILAVKSVGDREMKILSKASGANIVTSLKDLSKADIGKAGNVEERKISDKEYIFVEGCVKPKAATIFIRGATEHVVAEVERSLDDAISVVRDVIEDGEIIVGGGASAMNIIRRLRKFSGTVSGREQLAIIEFANALEVIPRTLAENAGRDPIDAVISLRAEHEKGSSDTGIDLKTGKPVDMFKQGVIEPARVSSQMIKSATEVAVMLLRIDDIIGAKGALGKSEGGDMPSAPPMPGGMY